jgi:hypothetical protein
LAHANLGESADRLDRSVADPLTESLSATQLGSLCQERHALACDISPLVEGLTNLIEIEMLRALGHT